MSTFRGILAESFNSSPTVRHLTCPTPGNGEVLVRVLATPLVPYVKDVLNGSRKYPLTFPLIPGSNAVARVDSVGPDAVLLHRGQLVFCDITVHARDDPNIQFLMGVHGGTSASQKLMEGPWRHSTFAEFAKFPLENVFALDEEGLCTRLGYSLPEISYLGNCLVPYGGLAGNIQAGDTVVVAPSTGKFGGAAVSMALAMGATVIAAGRNKDVLHKIQKAYGSTGRIKTTILTGDVTKDSANLKSHSNSGKGADAFIDFSPPTATNSTHITAAMLALRREGKAVLMGGILGNISIPYSFVMHHNIQVIGRFMYERPHVIQAIKMLENGILQVGKQNLGIETHSFGLDQFEEAVEVAAANTAWGSQTFLEP